MLKFFYDIAILLLGIFWLPKLFKGKYKSSLQQRLGFVLPKLDLALKGPIVWIHAVSVGETKAAAALTSAMKKRDPQVRIVISSITETGHAEAKRSIPDAEAYFYLPIDFSWVMRKCIRVLKPSLIILVVGEFWHNLMSEAKKSGSKIVLVNGKLSKRSAERFALVPSFSRRLFSNFDLLCLQTEEYKKAFLSLGISEEKLILTGNLKFDVKIEEFSEQEKEAFRQSLKISPSDFVVVLGSTHEGEEKILLDAIKPLFTEIPSLKILLVPRHPHRFDRVAELIEESGIPFARFTQTPTYEARCILIDTMGKLISCFQIAHIALLAGSFIPGIGGHNLFEPAACGLPVLFGPYTEAQQAYADALIASGGGASLTAQKISEKILELYENPSLRASMGNSAKDIVVHSMGAAKKTIEVLVAKSLA